MHLEKNIKMMKNNPKNNGGYNAAKKNHRANLKGDKDKKKKKINKIIFYKTFSVKPPPQKIIPNKKLQKRIHASHNKEKKYERDNKRSPRLAGKKIKPEKRP
jgi:hypothetical protein